MYYNLDCYNPCSFDFTQICDCDEWIIKTEEFNRLACNAAPARCYDLQVDAEYANLIVEYYDILQHMVEGKGKICHFRNTTEMPSLLVQRGGGAET